MTQTVATHIPRGSVGGNPEGGNYAAALDHSAAMMKYVRKCAQLTDKEIEVVNAGPVIGSPASMQEARKALEEYQEKFGHHSVDLRLPVAEIRRMAAASS